MFRTLLFVAMLLSVVSAAAAADRPAAAPTTASAAKALDPRTASLPEAIEDWVGLLELNYVDAPAVAARRWARDPAAADDLRRLWPELQKRHEQYDYRAWATGAHRPAADNDGDGVTSFTVGGHDYGHLHTQWVKTDAGWRIADVYLCR